jgi:dihydroxyacid dehydratase/phosphogluconate dehydratase
MWLDMARRSARALDHLDERQLKIRDVLTRASIENAMVLHAAFGGSTNLLLHIPAIAHAAGLKRPTADDWIAVNRRVPRLVSVLPNGPIHHPTVRVFLAGGVPEVMLHVRRLDLLGDVVVLTGIGPMGTGMEETYQVTGALKHLPFGKQVALLIQRPLRNAQPRRSGRL